MSWLEQVEHRASMLIGQIHAIKKIAERHGEDPTPLTALYQRRLSRLYEEEAPLARTLDDSDLVAWLRGPAVETDTPKITLVSTALSDLRQQITRVTKAALGMDERERFSPKDFDLAVSGIAHGSLVVGIKVMHPEQISKAQALFREEEDKVYQSVRHVIRQLARISAHIDDHRVKDSIRDVTKDPIERDSLLVAAHKIAPSGRRGIDEVQLIQGGEGSEPPGRALNIQDRRVLQDCIQRPVRSEKYATLRGTVRAVDLDDDRFEIRLTDQDNWRVRCYAPKMPPEMRRQLLDGRIEIYGRTEFHNNMPRLIDVEDVKAFWPGAINGLLKFD